MSLEGKIALVTGASRGIGQEIALQLGQHGATVIGTATSDSGADSITEIFRQNNVAGRGCKLDVNDAAGIKQTVKDIGENEGAPSILVNNAGITRDDLLLRMKEEAWDDIIDTNLKSVFRMSQACIRAMMKARSGRIINITSVVGSIGNPGQANYAAAKAGVAGFTRSIASELASRNITVNTIAPGFIETDMTRDLDEKQRQQLMERIPLQRLGTPADIAAAVVFLASDGASYITGSTLHVNGGMHMGP